MKPTYKIRNWDEHFENNESRKIKRLQFVLMPVKQDGKGYRRVVSHERGPELMGVWSVLVQVAAKMPERGILADEDGPLDAEDLHFITGLPAASFELAFAVLCQSGINWLESDAPGESPDISRNLPESPGTPGSAGSPILEQNRTEQKGTEGNETGGADKPPASPERKTSVVRFEPPSVQDVAEFCREKGYTVDAETFVAHYTANGWVQAGGQKIKNWKAAVVTWEKRGQSRASPVQASKPPQKSGLEALREKHERERDGNTITVQPIKPARIS